MLARRWRHHSHIRFQSGELLASSVFKLMCLMSGQMRSAEMATWDVRNLSGPVNLQSIGGNVGWVCTVMLSELM